MKTSTMLLLGVGGYVAYTFWKKQQAATGSSTAAVSGPAGAAAGPAVSGPAATSVDSTSYDEIDFVPVGWGPAWVSIMPGGGRRGGGGGHHHHGGGGHRGRH